MPPPTHVHGLVDSMQPVGQLVNVPGGMYLGGHAAGSAGGHARGRGPDRTVSGM